MTNKDNTEQSQASYQPIKRLSITNLTATILGLGYSKFAPGTLGSIVGLIDFSASIYFLHNLNFLYVPFVVLTSYYFINQYCHITKKHDPKEIILDEYAGQYLCCFLAYYLIGLVDPDKVRLYDHYVLNYFVLGSCFLFFRFFDITKLGLVGYFDSKTDSLSVLMDDLVAGVFAAVVTALIFTIV